MKILMIGNGFDLEHDLPTKYTDFLAFVRNFKGAYLYANAHPNQKDLIKDDYLKLIFTNCEFENRVVALHSFTDNNLWINYFQKVYKEHLANKENWIDFESEISDIIRTIDKLQKYYERITLGEEENKNLENLYNTKLIKVFKYKIDKENIDKNIPILLTDLNKLIGALEIYIWDYVGYEEIKFYNPDIEKIHPNKVFSFNYSDTYKKVYGSNRIKVDYSFTHGIATNNIQYFYGKEIGSKELDEAILINAENNTMVLGIDEYLPKERSSKEIDFIAFKKYYQRIYKKTGNEYKRWLKQIDDNVNAGRVEENILYIFGHSLDVTDGDVLREFINNKNLKTVIFYRNKEQLGQQIANLVKILKPEDVIEKVYGSSPTIIFQQQKQRELIEGSSFEITSDIVKLEDIYKLDQFEAVSLISKIKYKIEKCDLRYFYSQEKVISLFDAMQKNGLADRYLKKLLDIAYKLMKCEGLKEPEVYDKEKWAYADFDNSYTYDRLTEKFIETVNLYNKTNFVVSELVMQTFDEKLCEYEELIKSKKKIDKENYIAIINSIFYMFTDRSQDTDKLWNILLRISRALGTDVAEEILKELKEKSEDELEIIRLNHLLKELEINEYFSMMAKEFEESYTE